MVPTVEMYEAIDKLQKPVIACVNGFAVGGGNVLQVVCDITIAKESAMFRQVGPMLGSFDAGYGTWYLEDLIGKKRAKEMWYRNPRLTAREALEWGLINHEAIAWGIRIDRIGLNDRSAVTRGMLDRGAKQLVHKPLSTKFALDEEAGDRPDCFGGYSLNASERAIRGSRSD